MKRLLYAFLIFAMLPACVMTSSGPLKISFIEPSEWDGINFPASRLCSALGGIPTTPPLMIKNIPQGTNVLIVEFNDADDLVLSFDGGLGKVGYYHDGTDSAWLLPVAGETIKMPPFAFKEAANRTHFMPDVAYMPPCDDARKGDKHTFFALVKAVNRTGSFDKQVTTILAEGRINLGEY